MNTTLFRWPVRVYYEDTDAGGVVYHASYIAFYERARTEMLRHHHFSQQALMAERVAFVVRKMTVEYYAPARLDDMLEIQTEITSMRGTSLVFTQRIVNAENTLLNEAEVLIVCVDPLKMKPRALPKSIVAEFLASIRRARENGIISLVRNKSFTAGSKNLCACIVPIAMRRKP